MITVNAIGDACPIPVVKTRKAMETIKGSDVVETLVDNEIAVENLKKMAGQMGYQVKDQKLEEGKYSVQIMVTEAEKTEKIQENIERLQLSNVEVQVWDARVTDETMSGKADVLFLDVPCSGLGVMGKKRDIKYHVTPEGLAELEDLQKQIVDSCRDYLKPGGTLLYSTCTIDSQ